MDTSRNFFLEKVSCCGLYALRFISQYLHLNTMTKMIQHGPNQKTLIVLVSQEKEEECCSQLLLCEKHDLRYSDDELNCQPYFIDTTNIVSSILRFLSFSSKAQDHSFLSQFLKKNDKQQLSYMASHSIHHHHQKFILDLEEQF